jgi:DNA-binding FrmR family transcriptional regulator
MRAESAGAVRNSEGGEAAMATGQAVEQTLHEGARDEAATRLRKIEGQVRGLQAMLESDRAAPELLMQIASVQEALRGVGRVILQSRLDRAGRTRSSESAHREVLDLIYRYVR